MTRYSILFCVLLLANGVDSRPVNGDGLPDSRAVATQVSQEKSGVQTARGVSADYALGPGDQITLVVPGLEDQFNEKVFRIDASGDVTVPLVGRIHAAGLSTAALETDLQSRLKKILKDPEVVVNISSFGSQPVSILGAVKTPGIVQLQGRKTLFEVLSLAGGLQPESGYIVQVTRPLANGSMPLPNARMDPSAQVSVASIRLRDIINVPNAAENIEILPGDTISVPKTGIVYVVGSVSKPGGYPLDENESLSALQVLSLAQGLQVTAAASKARILRTVASAPTRAEIPVDLNRLMAGKGTDVQLRADDILFVPGSAAKKAGMRTIDAIVNAATYSVVYLH
jgi:polysaccharide export outer membrane protein